MSPLTDERLPAVAIQREDSIDAELLILSCAHNLHGRLSLTCWIRRAIVSLANTIQQSHSIRSGSAAEDNNAARERRTQWNVIQYGALVCIAAARSRSVAAGFSHLYLAPTCKYCLRSGRDLGWRALDRRELSSVPPALRKPAWIEPKVGSARMCRLRPCKSGCSQIASLKGRPQRRTPPMPSDCDCEYPIRSALIDPSSQQ